MSTPRSVPFALAAVLLAVPASAQEETREAETAASARSPDLAVPAVTTAQGRSGILYVQPSLRRTDFVLEAGEHALPELIDRAAVWLGRNYLTSENDFQGPAMTVRLQTEMHLDEDGLDTALGHLLFARGFAVMTLSEELGLYEVVSLNGPRRGEVMNRAVERSPEEVLERQDRIEMVSTTVVVHHLNAQIAVNSLRPFFAQSSPATGLTVGSTGDTRTVVLQGFAPQVATAIRMLHRADEAAADAQQREHLERIEQRVEQLEQRGR